MGATRENLPLIVVSAIVLVIAFAIFRGPGSGSVNYWELLKQRQRLEAVEEFGNEKELISGPPRARDISASAPSKPGRVRDGSNNIATGIEFLEVLPQTIEIDTAYFFGSPLEQFSNDSYFQFIQSFIRNVKGLPVAPTTAATLTLTLPSLDDRETIKEEWATQPYYLTQLSKTEFEIFKIFKFYSSWDDYQESPIPILESYLRDFHATSLRVYQMMNASKSWKTEEGPHFYIATHPLLVYQMIRRIVQDIPEIKNLLRSNQDLVGILYRVENELEVDFPTKLDLMEALSSIHRIQTGNDIKTRDLAKGKWEEQKTWIQVDVFQALEIGAFYLSKNTADLAMEWFHYGKELAKRSSSSDMYPVIVKFFELNLHFGSKVHNTMRSGGIPFQDQVNNGLAYSWGPAVYTKNVTLPYHPKNYMREFDIRKKEIAKFRLEFPQFAPGKWVQSKFFPVLYSRLCAGDNFQTKEEEIKLKCWLETKIHPYWFINPLKVELVHPDPPVTLVHDFISSVVQNLFREAALKNKLHRSEVCIGYMEEDCKSRHTRTSHQAWLDDDLLGYPLKQNATYEETVIYRFSERLEFLTGLNLLRNGSTETYQVAVYGSSQHFAPHLDPPVADGEKDDEDLGTRTTTIMGFLSNVTAGGRTAFPVLGFSVKPVKGSLLIWNNLMNDDYSRDVRSYHGGCPVTSGVKWIANKWVYDHGSMFKIKCGWNSPDVFLPTNLEQQRKFVTRG